MTGAIAISAHDRHTCALLASGGVRCWGYNTAGQLGDGTTTNILVPPTIDVVVAAVAIGTGSLHSCALVAGGTMRCWGAGNAGALGYGGTTMETSPVYVMPPACP